MYSLANENPGNFCPRSGWALGVAEFLLMSWLVGCNVGPKYVKPTVKTPPAYKETTELGKPAVENWKRAEPSDDTKREEWWTVYKDAQLDRLEESVNVSNQNIAAAAANFVAARALVREARSQYYPAVSTNPSITNARPSQAQFGGLKTGSSTSTGFSVQSYTNYSLPFEASWEVDLWGRVRNSVNADVFAAQASAADLENIRLSAQAELAADYYAIQGQDALKQVLEETVTAYRQALRLTTSRNKAGLDSEEAVAQAEVQLKSAEAQDANVDVLRAQLEHAIAVLVGQPASEFSLKAKVLEAHPPEVPTGIPSQLLERRPDIATAERTMAQANAQIGIAKAAFYPTVTLSATGGFGGSSFSNWLTWPSRFWSIGPSAAQAIFDAGLRSAVVRHSQAEYDLAIANYRQTVLTAFQQVEDNLATLRILSQVVEQQDAAVRAAQRNVDVATVRYRAGLDPYLNVVIAQTTLLNDRQAYVIYRTQQMEASVQLIKALGGGWDVSRIPPAASVRKQGGELQKRGGTAPSATRQSIARTPTTESP